MDRLSFARRITKVSQIESTAEHNPVQRALVSIFFAADPREEVENVVEKIVAQGRPPIGKQFTVRWYKFSPTDDSVESVHHIPKHFITQ